MKQKREPWKRPTLILSTLTNYQRQFNGESVVLITNGAGTTGYPHAECGPYTDHKK